jgi:hypothetical protein
MTKLARKGQKIFCGANIGSPSDIIAQFGSLKAAAPAYSSDPDTIQALAAYESGWGGAVVNNNSPAIQDMNALQYLFSRQLAYLFEAGIPEYAVGTTYYIGSIVRSIGGIDLYRSVIDTNVGQALTDTSKWQLLSLGSKTIATSAVNAINGSIIHANSVGGAFTITAPATPVASWSFVVYDVGRASSTNNITIGRNGEKINSTAANYLLNENGLRTEFIYVNASIGWSTHI